MQTVTLAGTKHGTGTSTIAAATARYLTGLPADVELIDAAPAQDLAAVCGLGRDLELGASCTIIDPRPTTPGRLTLTAGTLPAYPDTTHRVIDAGTLDDLTPADFDRGPVILVARECYLSLRRACASPNLKSCAGLLVIQEPGRALGAADIESVTGLPVIARVPYRANIARAVDAGALMTRPPDALRDGIASMLGALAAGVTK